MKRVNNILLSFIILVLINMSIPTCWGSEFNFRRTNWGMTKEEVISSEDSPIVDQNGKSARFNTIILGHTVELTYHFVDNQLVGATYLLLEKYLKTGSYIFRYNEFVEALIKKYGSPIRQEIIWFDETFKNIPDKKNLALSAGHVQYFSSWSTKETKIKCSLHGSFHNLIVQIDYQSIEHQDILNNRDWLKDPF